MKSGTPLLVAAVLLACVVRASAAEFEDLVKKSDLVLLGQVMRVDEGKLDADLLKMNVKARTDIAHVAVVEMLKGDPAVKKVEVGFPALAKEGAGQGERPGPTIERGQAAIFFVTKGEQKYYEAKTDDRVLPQEKLGAVRRAVRSAMGLADVGKPEDRAKRAARLVQELTAGSTESARRLAAFQLGEIGLLTSVPALIQALHDEAPVVRVAAELALRKITGYHTQADFQDGTAAVRTRAIQAWETWWAANRNKKRDEILSSAAEASFSPQPDFQDAIEGLAQSDDLEFQPLFLQALNSAVSSKSNSLAVCAAHYLGRVKNRGAVPVLAGLLRAGWTADGTRAAAANAIGNIVGESFGSDPVPKAIEWWQTNSDRFSAPGAMP
jgi:hypothetical protein